MNPDKYTRNQIRQTFGNNHLLLPVLKYEDGQPLGPAVVPRDFEGKSDKDLVGFIKKGYRPKAAFTKIYSQYYLDVWRLIKRKVFDEEDAQDIFSEVWLIASSGLSEFTWRDEYKTDSPVKSWLLTIARNKTSDHIRSIDKDKKLTQELALHHINNVLQNDTFIPSDRSTEEVIEEANILLKKAISRLKNKKQRQIITLKYFNSKKHKEIAQTLKMKTNTVTKEHGRALEKLSQIFKGLTETK